MSDNQPQHRNPYPPQDPAGQPDPYGRPDPYAPQDPHAPQAPYAPQDPYAAPDPYAAQPQQPAPGPYGRPAHDPSAQQPGHDPYGQQQAGHDPYGQQYGQQAYGRDQYGREAYGQQQYGRRPQHARPQPQQSQHPQQPPQQQPQQPHQPQPQPQPPHGHDGYRIPSAETSQLPTQHQSARPAEDPYGRAHPQQGRPAPGAPAAKPPLPTPPVSSAPLAANQRARAEGRSPIIPPGIQPAALTAGLALLLALTAPLGRPVLAVPVALLQAVTAAGWFRLNGMWPARQGIALAFLAGLTTDVALLATDRASAPLVGIGTLGVWCLLVLVLQLRNRSSADERMYALTAGLTSTALAVLAGGQLAASGHAVVVGAAGAAVATLARALPLPGPASIGVSLVAAAGAGIAAGQLTGLGVSGALLGLAAGGCALIGLRVASYDYPSRFVHLTAGVALPLALAAPAVYVLGRTLG
ncbi:hypothetical protein Stsp01_34110 [Streptomyces sp. NBRC 13847]|uniref:hypothetical protein n=1 Tax=Streptomyces TaxID=1883 RepID=UPI00249FDE2A|nr:hypothetical protein [Streptomyces sp. NBRC 13847]GLW16668.1 hypothetical protein Stsp01_34110 [Streptomyces sp. NBRC 13847]